MTDIHLAVADGLAEIVFNRPGKKNAIARSTIDALEDAVRTLQDSGAGALLLRGADHTFVAGGDLADLHALPSDEALAVMDRMRAILQGFADAPFPVVAYVEGDAVGGGVEIALAADLVLAQRDARFFLAQVPMGLIPGWGGTTFLERRLGPARARALLLQGARLSAEDARAFGMVDGVVADLGEARREALHLASMPPAAVAAVKAITGRAPGDGRELFASLWNSPDHGKRVERFLKRGRRDDG